MPWRKKWRAQEEEDEVERERKERIPQGSWQI
jgi:hypothetical protein